MGCHAFSVDGVTWRMGSRPAYNTTLVFGDGSSTTLKRRERPQLVFDPTSGKPLYLINGAMPQQQPPGGQGDYSYSIIVPLAQ